jgi:signal transduction histidine kinase
MIDKRGVMTNIGAPRVRLTLAYAALLVLLLAAFSIIVYVLLSMVVFQDIEPFRDDPGIVAAAHRMLDVYLVRLLIANAFGLIFVVAVAAFLAKITLRPLERAIALQRQFTNDASHDLRTPLAVIRTEASVGLADLSLPAAVREQLRIVDEQAQRMQRLIDQLITLSHLDADSALDREPTDLRAVVNGVVRDLQPLAQARAVVLHVGRSESAVVMGDELKLSQLVGNLVDNAIKHGKERSRVDISVWQTRDTAFVAVSDEGSGIVAADLERIFERYQRVNGAPGNGAWQNGEVHGLGLPLCRWIARAHGGEVTARSIPGEGSVFTVRLPAMVP